MAVSAHGEETFAVAVHRLPRKHQHRQVRTGVFFCMAHRFKYRQAIHAGHHHIEQQQIHPLLRQGLQGLNPIARCHHAVAELLKQRARHRLIHRVVFGQQYRQASGLKIVHLGSGATQFNAMLSLRR